MLLFVLVGVLDLVCEEIEVLLAQDNILIRISLIPQIEERLEALISHIDHVTKESDIELPVSRGHIDDESRDVEIHQAILVLLNEVIVGIQQPNNGVEEECPDRHDLLLRHVFLRQFLSHILENLEYCSL